MSRFNKIMSSLSVGALVAILAGFAASAIAPTAALAQTPRPRHPIEDSPVSDLHDPLIEWCHDTLSRLREARYFVNSNMPHA